MENDELSMPLNILFLSQLSVEVTKFTQKEGGGKESKYRILANFLKISVFIESVAVNQTDHSAPLPAVPPLLKTPQEENRHLCLQVHSVTYVYSSYYFQNPWLEPETLQQPVLIKEDQPAELNGFKSTQQAEDLAPPSRHAMGNLEPANHWAVLN